MAVNGQLLIESLKTSTTKLELGYWCQIRNKMTGDTFLSQSAGKIKLTEHRGGVPPSITHISDAVSAKLGQPVELSCIGQGYPVPKYKWKSNADGKIISTSSTFQIESTPKAGTFEYSCIVTNKFGSDERKSTVIVRGR